MPDFGNITMPDDQNGLLNFSNYGLKAAQTQAAQQANQLAAATLGSNTQIAANNADSGSLANQLAAQKNPLTIVEMRQQLGLDPSPALDKLRDLYNGGNGQPPAPAAGAQPASVGATPAAGASATVPADYVPFYQEASARTGIPVSVLMGQGAQESGFNPGATGAAGEIGIHQIKPSTAADPGYGMTGINPATLRDPRTNINFAADYLKARGGAKADFTSPAVQNAALAAYNGGGDPNYVANVRSHMAGPPGPGGGVAPGIAVGAGTTETEDAAAPPHHGPDPNHTLSVGGTLANLILQAPPDQRPAMYKQLLPVMRQTGANVAENYPGDAALARVRDIAFNPDQRAAHLATLPSAPGATAQVAGPGAPTAAQAPIDPGQPPPAPPDVAPAAQGAPDGVTQYPNTGAATAAMGQGYPAPPPIPNENGLLATGAPGGGAPLSTPPPSQLMPAASAAPPGQLMPSASASPPAQTAAPAAAQPGTGMNSPQVQQAQELIRRATQIEMAAAQTPNDPRAKATAAAMAADLRGRAAVIMQADSVTVGPNGVQTHTLTGKQDPAATPAMNYQPDPNNPGVLISPGAKPVVLPPGRPTILPDKSVGVTGPGGTFKTVVNPNLEGISEAATAAAGGTAAATAAAKTKDALIPLARTSGQAIGNIDYGLSQLDAAAKGGIPTGYYADGLAASAAAAKYLGIKLPGVDPAAVSNIQTAAKTLAVVSGAILQNILGPNAEITEGKIEAFIHAQPGIVNDPQATHRILNWARSQFTYDHEMAMDGLAHVDPKSGQLPPGWQAGYITAHGSAPIYDPVSGEMKQPDGQAPGREPPAAAPEPPVVSTAAQHQSLAPGTTYVDPQGNTRTRR